MPQVIELHMLLFKAADCLSDDSCSVKFYSKNHLMRGNVLHVCAIRSSRLDAENTAKNALLEKQDFNFWVKDGTRTHDPQNHNLVL